MEVCYGTVTKIDEQGKKVHIKWCETEKEEVIDEDLFFAHVTWMRDESGAPELKRLNSGD